MSGIIQKASRGFTAIELVVYVAIFSAISVFLVGSLLTLTVAYRRLQNERDLVSGVRTIMETLGREIQGAKSIYTPTTSFSAAQSQLSLESVVSPSSGESLTYVDFYLDNSRLYLKREGASAIALNPASTEVSDFRAERVANGSRESGQVFLKITTRATGNLETASVVTASFTPRGNY